MDANNKDKISLLELSRELRDKVYEILLVSSRPTPNSPEEAGPRRSANFQSDDEWPVWAAQHEVNSWDERNNHYPLENPGHATASLQRTCRQIHEEVTEAMNRLRKHGRLQSKLDIMVVDDRHLYPTWLAINPVGRQIPILRVNIRSSGDVSGDESGWKGSPSALVWMLYTLLERFIRYGPDFLPSAKRIKRLQICHLAINVVQPSPRPHHGFYGKGTSVEFGNAKGLLNPEEVLRLLKGEMTLLLQRTKSTDGYAKIIFPRVRRISFLFNGKGRQSLRLSTLVQGERPEWS